MSINTIDKLTSMYTVEYGHSGPALERENCYFTSCFFKAQIYTWVIPPSRTLHSD